jgi:hypothetical protein
MSQDAPVKKHFRVYLEDGKQVDVYAHSFEVPKHSTGEPDVHFFTAPGQPDKDIFFYKSHIFGIAPVEEEAKRRR